MLSTARPNRRYARGMAAFHPLDYPALSALTGRQARFAVVRGKARRYHPDVGVFAGIEARCEAGLADLARLVTAQGDVALLEAEAPPSAPGLRIVSQDLGVQMVGRQLRPAPAAAVLMRELGDADGAAMLALAAQTEPGPFFARTRELGDFLGIDVDGRLVAMAGERMKPDGYTEISGVCTDAAFRGRGYASALMQAVAARILSRGEVPFLHAYASNDGAIALYQRLGFTIRREIQMTRMGSDVAGGAPQPG